MDYTKYNEQSFLKLLSINRLYALELEEILNKDIEYRIKNKSGMDNTKRLNRLLEKINKLLSINSRLVVEYQSHAQLFEGYEDIFDNEYKKIVDSYKLDQKMAQEKEGENDVPF